jgi:hypothetical protein
MRGALRLTQYPAPANRATPQRSALTEPALLDAQTHLLAAAALLKLDLTIEFAGFGQVMQCLLNPTEAFYRNGTPTPPACPHCPEACRTRQLSCAH